MDRTYVFLCLASDYKGGAFLRQLKRLGHMVYLVTSEKTRKDAWPYDDIEEVFFMPGTDGRIWDINELLAGTAHLFRTHKIDRVIALDDYDVWKAARIREDFRIPGMGDTTARHFLINFPCAWKQGMQACLFPDLRPCSMMISSMNF